MLNKSTSAQVGLPKIVVDLDIYSLGTLVSLK